MEKRRLAISASFAALVLTLSFAISPILAGSADPVSPTLTVVPSVATFPANNGFDSTLYVNVPNNSPPNGNFYDLTPAFVVQNISYTVVGPGQRTQGPFLTVSCSTPDYPARYSISSCSGLYPGRVDTRAYWGSNTGIYFLGLVGFSPATTYTITFIVTGLYFSNSITLTASETVQST